MRLGKALNDPIKGISALTRVGVTFTDSQKEQIKTLVESGDTMEAQRIILKELTSEFGGAAEAAADPWSRLTVVLGNVKEEIGTALLPAFEAVADWLSVFLPKAIDRTKEALRDARAWWDRNKDSVEILASILVDTFVPASNESEDAIKDFTVSLGTLANFLTDVTVFVLELIKVWLSLEHVTIGIISVFGSLMMAAGHVTNAIDKLSGGTGHAGDKFVELGRKAKDQATRELKEVRKAALNAQDAIDRLHGKDVKISGTTSLNFTRSFTANDWAIARKGALRGFGQPMAAGGKITSGTGPTADDVLIRASKGETVVPAAASRDPGFQSWAAGQGIPGFALGGKIDQTGQAHSGVGKAMDRYGTIFLAGAVKKAMEEAAGFLGGMTGAGGWQWQMRGPAEPVPRDAAHQRVTARGRSPPPATAPITGSGGRSTFPRYGLLQLDQRPLRQEHQGADFLPGGWPPDPQRQPPYVQRDHPGEPLGPCPLGVRQGRVAAPGDVDRDQPHREGGGGRVRLRQDGRRLRPRPRGTSPRRVSGPAEGQPRRPQRRSVGGSTLMAWWLGPAGALVQLPAPAPGYNPAVIIKAGTHELLGGGHVQDRLGIRRRYTLTWPWQADTNFNIVRALVRSLGPFRYIDGAERNLLTANQSNGTDDLRTTEGFSARTQGTISSSTTFARSGQRSAAWATGSALGSTNRGYVLATQPP